MVSLKKEAAHTADFLVSKTGFSPLVGIITGTGLSESVAALKAGFSIAYDQIPNFPVSTVQSHTGILKTGHMGKVPAVVMQGRFHLYEGYEPSRVVFPVRVMQEMGIKYLVVSNAAGGMNSAFEQGDIMIICDHINLTGENPLAGPNEDAWGPRFPDMINAYDKSLGEMAGQAGKELGIALKSGIYAGLKGPSLETPAEIRYLKTIGADAVGFSTVMETICAVHANMKVLGLSTITNINNPDNPVPATVEEIIAAAGRAAPKMEAVIEKVVEKIGSAHP